MSNQELAEENQVFRRELTAKLEEVCLDFSPGVEEHPALLRPHCDHAVFVHGDTRHLRIELRHRQALQHRDKKDS